MNTLNNEISLQAKAIKFITALHNVYVQEDERAPLEGIELGDDFNEDITAMLMAVKSIAQGMCSGLKDYDLIDFTHILNKLAVQHLMESNPEISTKVIE